MTTPGGNVQPHLDAQEHNSAANAKKAVVKGFDGSAYPDLNVDSAGRANVNINGTVPVSPRTTTAGTPAGFTVSTSAVLLAASNANRRAIAITNNGSTNIFLGHTAGVTATGATLGLKLTPGGTYTDSGDGLYTGDLYGIGDATASSQNVSVSERT